MSNYPDDIRRFDHDSRSPFSPECRPDHDEPRCEGCREYEDECKCEEDAGQTPAQYVKLNGVKSLTEVSRMTGVSLQTLSNWYNDKPDLFRVVVAGCKALST